MNEHSTASDDSVSKRLAAVQFIADVLSDRETSLGEHNTLQALIDIAPDHNQMMLDAIKVVDPSLHLLVMLDLHEGAGEPNYEVLNDVFAEVRVVLMEETQ